MDHPIDYEPKLSYPTDDDGNVLLNTEQHFDDFLSDFFEGQGTEASRLVEWLKAGYPTYGSLKGRWFIIVHDRFYYKEQQ